MIQLFKLYCQQTLNTRHGPHRVIFYEGSKYVLANLVTHKERSVHIKNSNFFNYDSEVDIPADTTRRDYMEFVVEKVLSHSGDAKKPTAMLFQSNGLITMTLITHGSRGKTYGFVKHFMNI